MLGGTVVFLDIDGVLHSLHGDDLFRGTCCDMLEHIVRTNGAILVLSSTWRTEAAKVAMVNAVLASRNLAPIASCTKTLDSEREVEICEWLDRHPGVSRWIAIDDLDLEAKSSIDARRMRGHCVRTDPSVGLLPKDAVMATKLLLNQVGGGQVRPGASAGVKWAAERKATRVPLRGRAVACESFRPAQLQPTSESYRMSPRKSTSDCYRPAAPLSPQGAWRRTLSPPMPMTSLAGRARAYTSPQASPVLTSRALSPVMTRGVTSAASPAGCTHASSALNAGSVCMEVRVN
mmetsp:Transcript_34361/g.94674  ORF Transcript_34361/g.94674 Transcript_34361/m.94674 type:complete len:290 (+) Transcript_34361:185-1054(+)|eukprot:CAMPEP_0117575990 /NCGR_PEP_ID=MMETSP0784-20121206/62537_1 /TAXON_ID=39447 /ORGANISM="" /LENGTH=289 /DNA_ID=CAMNT_0005375169 /DNA_START=115 /DNA_END=984 /DNA_ORIENTATION=+